MQLRANYTALLIRGRRKELKLSQVKLGSQIGVHSQFISNIERGISQFPIAHINMLSVVLRLPLDTIIKTMGEDYCEAIKINCIGDV